MNASFFFLNVFLAASSVNSSIKTFTFHSLPFSFILLALPLSLLFFFLLPCSFFPITLRLFSPFPFSFPILSLPITFTFFLLSHFLFLFFTFLLALPLILLFSYPISFSFIFHSYLTFPSFLTSSIPSSFPCLFPAITFTCLPSPTFTFPYLLFFISSSVTFSPPLSTVASSVRRLRDVAFNKRYSVSLSCRGDIYK